MLEYFSFLTFAAWQLSAVHTYVAALVRCAGKNASCVLLAQRSLCVNAAIEIHGVAISRAETHSNAQCSSVQRMCERPLTLCMLHSSALLVDVKRFLHFKRNIVHVDKIIVRILEISRITYFWNIYSAFIYCFSKCWRFIFHNFYYNFFTSTVWRCK